MELAMQEAHDYMKAYRANRLEEHKSKNSNEKKCSGLTNREWFITSTRQKNTFSKSKKFSYTRLWNHKHVSTEQGFESLTIKLYKK
jgi:hypothetical protein